MVCFHCQPHRGFAHGVTMGAEHWPLFCKSSWKSFVSANLLGHLSPLAALITGHVRLYTTAFHFWWFAVTWQNLLLTEHRAFHLQVFPGLVGRNVFQCDFMWGNFPNMKSNANEIYLYMHVLLGEKLETLIDKKVPQYHQYKDQGVLYSLQQILEYWLQFMRQTELSRQKTCQGYSVGDVGCSCVFYMTVPRFTISDSVSSEVKTLLQILG